MVLEFSLLSLSCLFVCVCGCVLLKSNLNNTKYVSYFDHASFFFLNIFGWHNCPASSFKLSWNDFLWCQHDRNHLCFSIPTHSGNCQFHVCQPFFSRQECLLNLQEFLLIMASTIPFVFIRCWFQLCLGLLSLLLLLMEINQSICLIWMVLQKRKILILLLLN